MLVDKLLSNLTVSVAPLAICEVNPAWRLVLPASSRTALHFALRGHGVVRDAAGQAHSLAPMHLAVVPRGSGHALECGDKSRIQHERRINALPSDPGIGRIVAGRPESAALIVACGTVDVRYGSVLDPFDRLDRIVCVDLSSIESVESAFDDMLYEQLELLPGRSAMIGARMTQCMLHFFRQLLDEKDNVLPWLIGCEDSRVARAIETILNSPAAHHTVESLSASVSMSRSAFAERFTSVLGRTPIAFLHDVRMQRAAEMLSTGALPIDEVARRVGFSSRSHFVQSFKKYTGSSPREFCVIANHPTARSSSRPRTPR